MFVFCMYVRLLFDIDTFADDGDSGLMKYSNLVVNTLQYFLVNVMGCHPTFDEDRVNVYFFLFTLFRSFVVDMSPDWGCMNCN